MGRHRTAAEKAALREQVGALRAAGRSRREIRAELRVGDDLLTELLEGMAVPDALRRPRAKDDQREVARELRAQGRTYDDIATELAVSKGTLSSWLRGEARGAGQGALHTVRESQGASSSQPLARRMRRDGALLREIADEFGVSVKTAWRWCRDLPTPERARHGGDADHVRMMSRKRWDAVLAERDLERQEVTRAAQRRVGALTGRELELLAVTAYWCEGSKSKPYERRETVAFINSDPDLITLWLEFLLRRGYGIDRLRLHLSIHESADLETATRYWASVVGVDVSCFGKPSLKRHQPRTNRKNTGERYVGCLVIRVLQGRRLYQEIEGLWSGIAAGVLPLAGPVAS